ncbi:MAG: TonB-dependent receptor [Thalassotalea sp.]|nr:TonB-dependent receptor [Thalassotalea sp.]
MNRFKLSPIAVAMITCSGLANADDVSDKNIERISVYGQHNELILSSGTATKSDMDLIEIPAAIVVVGKELIEQQGVTSLQEVINNISGLNQAGNNYGIGDNLVIRGLGVSYTYDGMYAGADLSNSFNPTRSMTNVESIEVLKGPATGLYGIGAAGGVINLVEKKPQHEGAYSLRASLGEWDSQQIMLDATGPLSQHLAYRLVANHEKSDGYRGLSDERTELYSTLSLDSIKGHVLTLSAAYVDDSVQVDSIGHPVRILNHDSINGDPQDWLALVNDSDGDNDGNFGIQLTDEQRQQLAESIEGSDGFKPYDLGEQALISPLSSPNEGQELRIKVKSEWQIDTDMRLTQQFQYRDYESEFVRQTGAFNYVYWNRSGEINANPRAPLVIDDVIYPFSARRQEYRRQQSDEQSWQYFADFQVKWEWMNMTGEHLVSANYENRDMHIKSWSIYDADGTSAENAVPYILDIRNPNWPAGSFDDYSPSLRSNYDKSVVAAGISVQEVVYFTDDLTGRFGGAYTKVKQEYQHLGTDRSPLQTEEADTDDKGFTYNVGLNYRITPEFAVFANLAKGRTAYSILGSISSTQQDNRPDSESESVDIGVRFTALNEELIASIVWFDTSRTNLRYSNPLFNDNPDDDEFNIDVPQYLYDDEDKTTGVEFDMNLDISEALSMNANATYQDAELIRNSNRGTSTPVSGPVKGIPEKFASIWAHYRESLFGLSGEFNASVGLTYEDERTINSVSFGLPVSVIDSYSVWDTAIGYETKQWQVRLNLNNVFDKTYYSKAMFLSGLPGEGRNAKVTFDYHF